MANHSNQHSGPRSGGGPPSSTALRRCLAGLFALASLGLAGCGTTAGPVALPLTSLWQDSAFSPPTTTPDPAAAAQPGPRLQTALASMAPLVLGAPDPRRELLRRLFPNQSMRLEYDSARTRSAEEAWSEQRGNCLSLVLVTAVAARQLGLPFEFLHVQVDEQWTQQGRLMLASGHVQLALPSRRAATGEQTLVVDFLPSDNPAPTKTQRLEWPTVLAMFMNNRAAEALVRGDVDDAYWHSRAALLQDPNYLAALNTLGVVYSQRGLLPQAQQVFEALLLREPDNVKALGNLVRTLQSQGLQGQALALQARLDRLEPYPPLHFLRLGKAAAAEGRWAEARQHLHREQRRQPANAEVHFWLARTAWALGQADAATSHLTQALALSTTADTQALYGAKLAWLRAQAPTASPAPLRW